MSYNLTPFNAAQTTQDFKKNFSKEFLLHDKKDDQFVSTRLNLSNLISSELKK
jgi:hypothetical protein